MKKLFRFKYEPCNGTCYTWCDVLPTELRKLTQSDREDLVNKMVQAHDKLCDNPNYSFGVDLDQENRFFVAHFRTPEKLDLYSGLQFKQVVEKVCEAVFKADIPIVAADCIYGSNGAEDLGKEILSFCEDIKYLELQSEYCECKAQTPFAHSSNIQASDCA